MIVLGILLGILLLILLLPVGAYAHYDGEALIRLLIGPLRIQLVPAKPKSRKQLEKAQKKKAKKAAKKAEKQKKDAAKKLIKPDPPPEPKVKEPLKDKIAGLLPFAKLAVDALGSVFRKLKIKKLQLHVRLADGNKAKLGESYGKAVQAASAIRPVLRRAFRVKKADILILPDFCADKTDVEATIQLRFFVFDLIGIALKYGFRGIKLLFARKKQQKTLVQQQKAALLKEPDDASSPDAQPNPEKKAV